MWNDAHINSKGTMIEVMISINGQSFITNLVVINQDFAFTTASESAGLFTHRVSDNYE